MRRLIAATTAAIVLMPATAEAKPLEQKYTDLRAAVVKRFGKRVPGRNIRRHGVRTPHGRVVPARPRHYARSIRTFRRYLAPPAPVAAPGDRISSKPAYAGGRWAIPAGIVMCESHGNYGAVNPSSGAGGAYQILPSTWQAMGGRGLPQNASPAEQDRVAAKVWRVQGRSAWVC